jgi:hypothetical protein
MLSILSVSLVPDSFQLIPAKVGAGALMVRDRYGRGPDVLQRKLQKLLYNFSSFC